MPICLQNIVTVRDYCSNQVLQSTSGYDLIDAPEINRATLSQLANADYVTGLKLLKECLRFAIRDVENDFIAFINANGFRANILSKDIYSGIFDNTIINSAVGVERGITIFRNQSTNIKKLKIKEIQVYPLVSIPSIDLKFYDSGMVSVVPIELVAGQLNKFAVDYTVNGDFVKILLDNTALSTYSSKLTCMTTCTGAMPNDCGHVMGYNGVSETQKEGFGINAIFSCECDFTQLLCQFSKSYVGKIIWLKARVYALEEKLRTNRLTNFLIYNREETINLRLELENEYRSLWNGFVTALPELLKYTNDECIVCNGIQLVTNV